MARSGNRSAIVAAFLLLWFCLSATPVHADPWQEVLDEAAGQTVYFNAWGGDIAINRYVDWAAAEVVQRYDVQLRHVRVTDIAEAVTRIVAERAAGREAGGKVDLLWINGENFATLKNADLLYGPWANDVPNAARIDWQGNPTTRVDGGLDTEGYELPWGTAAFTFFYDEARVSVPPHTPAKLLSWVQRHPGRFSYPQPPAFLGSAFLKQMLIALTDNRDALYLPAGDNFDDVTQPLWTWLDSAHPHLWRRGRLFPPSGPAQRDLLAVGELDWMVSYNPAEARRAILQGELHETIGATSLESGALANSHFLAIPYNASAAAGAQVVANFLVSVEAQARKADVRYWGDPTVLETAALTADEQARRRLADDDATPSIQRYAMEPHPSWTTRLEQAWLERYVR